MVFGPNLGRDSIFLHHSPLDRGILPVAPIGYKENMVLFGFRKDCPWLGENCYKLAKQNASSFVEHIASKCLSKKIFGGLD